MGTGQGRKSILSACERLDLRLHYTKNRRDAIIEITAWAQKRTKKAIYEHDRSSFQTGEVENCSVTR